jgi:hypothetical protein
VGAVRRGAVGVVEQAGDEVRRSATEREVVAFQQVQHFTWIPAVEQVHRPTVDHRYEQGAKHADEVAYRCGDELVVADRPDMAGQLTRLADQRLVAVDDALRVTGRAGGKGDQGWAGWG